MRPSDAVIEYFDRQIVQARSTEKVVRGYRVKVDYDASVAGEMAKKEEKIVKAVSGSMRKGGK